MAAVFDPRGRIIHRYHKQKYVRMAGIENGPSGNISSVADTVLGRLAVMICYDADYPALPAEFASAGGEIFIVPSHDLAGFLTRHHPSMEMFRGVENRRTMVKSDYVHGTLIMDPKGRILADPPDGRHIVMAEVPLTRHGTRQPSGQYAFGILCLVVFTASALLARKTSR
jgi:apolipoprotein N-acyltransferase